MKQGQEQQEKQDVTFRDGNRNMCVIRKDPEETQEAPELRAPPELEQRESDSSLTGTTCRQTTSITDLIAPPKSYHVDCLFFILSSVSCPHSQSVKHANSVL